MKTITVNQVTSAINALVLASISYADALVTIREAYLAEHTIDMVVEEANIVVEEAKSQPKRPAVRA